MSQSRRSRVAAYVSCGLIGAFLTFFALLEYAFTGFHKPAFGLEIAGLALPAFLVKIVFPRIGEVIIWAILALELVCVLWTGGHGPITAFLLLIMGLLAHASTPGTGSKSVNQVDDTGLTGVH